jgi:cell filamentation protein
MAERSRYSVNEKESGLENGVLKNKMGLKTQIDIDDMEAILLTDAYEKFYNLLSRNKIIDFDFALITEIHKYFFGKMYSWAGKIRMVDISKDGILFASVRYLDELLKDFDKLIKKKLPRRVEDRKGDIALKLAVIHNEFNAIHPFRDGNGRTIRVFLDLLAVNSDYKPINWTEKTLNNYIIACKAGILADHEPMKKFIYASLKKQ